MTPTTASTSPIGLHRVTAPANVLPQAAQTLDATPQAIGDELRIAVDTLNLDAASYRQLREAHTGEAGLDADAIRQSVLDIVATRGKMQNPVTGSGGMLIGVVDQVGPDSPHGLQVGDRVATLVSLSLTPLHISDGLVNWDGGSEQVPTQASAILFGQTIVAKIPDDLPSELSLMVMDVCGAPALVDRWVRHLRTTVAEPTVAVLGGAGKSGALSLVAARKAGAVATVGVVPHQREADMLLASGLADHVVIADARQPIALAQAVTEALGKSADMTVVCVDVPGCEHGAILATAQGGVVIFFSMATSFSTAALGAEGLASDVTMLIGNGFVPGHADLAMALIRENDQLRTLFMDRLASEHQ